MISIAAFKKKRTIEMRCGPGRFKIGIIVNWHNIVYRVFKVSRTRGRLYEAGLKQSI